MIEHKTLRADSLPSAENLDDLAKEGWEMISILPDPSELGNYILYMKRLKTGLLN